MLNNAFSASTTWTCFEFALQNPETEEKLLSKAKKMLCMNKAVYLDEMLLLGVKGKLQIRNEMSLVFAR